MGLQEMATRVFKVIAIGAIWIFVGCLGLFLSLALEHSIPVTLPASIGPFEVGRAIFAWKDDKTPDVLAPVAGAKRELLVWMWYPADPGTASGIDDYMP